MEDGSKEEKEGGEKKKKKLTKNFSSLSEIATSK